MNSASIAHKAEIRSVKTSSTTRSFDQRLLATNGSRIQPILRLTLAVVIFPHGAQKLLGWFGGYGFDATMQYFAGDGIPAILAFLVIFAEFFGSIALAFGFLSRIATLGIASVMIVAIPMVHAANGFFMNWCGAQGGEGFEYHLLVLGLCLAVFIGGGGAYSLDRKLTR